MTRLREAFVVAGVKRSRRCCICGTSHRSVRPRADWVELGLTPDIAPWVAFICSRCGAPRLRARLGTAEGAETAG